MRTLISALAAGLMVLLPPVPGSAEPAPVASPTVHPHEVCADAPARDEGPCSPEFWTWLGTTGATGFAVGSCILEPTKLSCVAAGTGLALSRGAEEAYERCLCERKAGGTWDSDNASRENFQHIGKCRLDEDGPENEGDKN